MKSLFRLFARDVPQPETAVATAVAHLAATTPAVDYAALAQQNRLAVFDYPYAPRQRNWSGQPGFRALCSLLESEVPRYLTLLREVASMRDFFESIPVQAPESSSPRWLNDWITAVDAMALCALLKRHNPAIYMEVGSGNSTKFARKTIAHYGLRTKIISIDPAPRADVNSLCDEIVRFALEQADLGIFGRLAANDVLFVDNSHRSFANSDVTVFFTEVLPALPSGLVWGIHDIFLPDDYPQVWNDEKRFYNEQYLLFTYLLGGAGRDHPLLPNAYLSHHSQHLAAMTDLWESPKLQGVQSYGCAFWMQRGGIHPSA